MEGYPRNNICCKEQKNILETDGTHVCSKCGLVNDMLCLNESNVSRTCQLQPTLLDEFCDRAGIDTRTKLIASQFYNKSVNLHPTLHKPSLLACSLYIACKKSNVPRTIKEISAVTGCDIKYITRYEAIISDGYYTVLPSQYVNRFGSKIGLSYSQIRRVIKFLNSRKKQKKVYNPASVAAAAIYRTLSPDMFSISQLENVTGVALSTMKRVCKHI